MRQAKGWDSEGGVPSLVGGVWGKAKIATGCLNLYMYCLICCDVEVSQYA